MQTQFFSGLTTSAQIGAVRIFEMPNKKGHYRIFTDYASAKSQNLKASIASLLDTQLNADWQWHHVIEKTHIKLLFNANEVDHWYQTEIPCVLVHNQTEHVDFNRLLHTAGTKAVFDLPTSKNILDGGDRKVYLESLYSLYNIVYGSDTILKTVSHNVLNCFLGKQL
jgi:hypothetical protein